MPFPQSYIHSNLY